MAPRRGGVPARPRVLRLRPADARGARLSTDLLERERELAELDELMRAARRGTGAAVVIEGAAGLGKTRLLDGLRDRARRAGMRVLHARATELEQAFPYGVVRQLFEPGLLERTPLGASVPEPPAPAERSFATLYALYWLTADLAGEGPLLLAVDDAHWADAASLQFLLFLSARVEELPALVAVAARAADGELGRLAADPATRRIAPGALSPASTAELLARALGAPPEAAFADACHELTGGNPFLVSELARTLADAGIAPTAAEAARVRERVPESIARAVSVRLAALPAAAQALARAVAVLGDGCEPHLAAALAALPREAVADAADALRGADILDRDRELRFGHPLVRNAVYADLPAGARSRDHERAAALLAAEGVPAERQAIHLLATDPAGDERVVRTLRDAARAALAQGAPGAAIAYFRRALDEPPAAAERADVLEELVHAGLNAADPSVLQPFEGELLDGFTADAGRLVRTANSLALWLFGTGRREPAVELLERAIEAAEGAGDLDAAVWLETQLAAMTQLPPAPARERLRRYEGRLASDSPGGRLALSQAAWWSSLLGERAADAAALARDAIADGRLFAEHLDSPAVGQPILVLARADELDAAEAGSERVIAAATARGSVPALAGGWWLRGYVAHRRGALPSAEADARQAVDAARVRGFLFFVPLWTGLLVELLAERDELDAAERELELSGMAGEIPDGYWFGPVLFGRGRLRLAQGRAREAAADLLDLRDRMGRWELRGNPGSPAAAYGGLAVAALGERDRAIALAEEEVSNAGRWGAASVVGEAQIALGVVTGGEAGIEVLREAVATLRASPARLLEAGALAELGTLLRHEGERADARAPLREALDLARRCGGVALARRAAAELEATGERVERHTPIGADALTPSERRVAEMAARGMTNREIAAALYVTIKTVESHLRAAYDKLGIASRRELGDAL